MQLGYKVVVADSYQLQESHGRLDKTGLSLQFFHIFFLTATKGIYHPFTGSSQLHLTEED